MTTITLRGIVDFPATLAAQCRSSEIPEAEDLYGWLVGSWELDVLHYFVDVSALKLKGEAHFGWVLEGRAVQDTWIMPRQSERTSEIAHACNMYGTTLRVWNPAIRAWRITWINPVSNQRCDMIGRRIGKEIVQIGALANGAVIRWRFTEITSDSFHWIGEALEEDGATWKLQGEFLARRIR
ncbi:MAG TPA: hypothetical protein VFE61_11050 [Candidatus Sulfotelmatobacter sp.]|jgi:hypothetical protein|nr:hypothetical protein [Candidatus Sulfotelmatobacter sp.]